MDRRAILFYTVTLVLNCRQFFVAVGTVTILPLYITHNARNTRSLKVFKYFCEQLYFEQVWRSDFHWCQPASTLWLPLFLRTHASTLFLFARARVCVCLSLSSLRCCPFPLASLLFEVHATQLAIYIGYLCNGSNWLPARSTNTGIACTRQSHTKLDRNLYTVPSATN